jgi:hypothetical protein
MRANNTMTYQVRSNERALVWSFKNERERIARREVTRRERRIWELTLVDEQ